MNHKRHRPKFQRAGCRCMCKADKNDGKIDTSTLRKIDPEHLYQHGKLRRWMSSLLEATRG